MMALKIVHRKFLRNCNKAGVSVFIITNPDMGYNISRVVKNWNAALELVRNRNMVRTDYHLIATHDTEYAPDYAFRLISYLDSNPEVAIASGNYTNHKPEMPHGAGRYVRNTVFEKTRWKGSYPEQMGYESANFVRSGISWLQIFCNRRGEISTSQASRFKSSLLRVRSYYAYAWISSGVCIRKICEVFFNRHGHRATWIIIHDLLLPDI